jgi:hypothetical protein
MEDGESGVIGVSVWVEREVVGILFVKTGFELTYLAREVGGGGDSDD